MLQPLLSLLNAPIKNHVTCTFAEIVNKTHMECRERVFRFEDEVNGDRETVTVKEVMCSFHIDETRL